MNINISVSKFLHACNLPHENLQALATQGWQPKDIFVPRAGSPRYISVPRAASPWYKIVQGLPALGTKG